jgi:hypothetical protein
VRRLEWISRVAFSAIAVLVFLIGFAVCDHAWQGAVTQIELIPAADAPNDVEAARAGIISQTRAVVNATAILMLFLLLVAHNVLLRVVLRVGLKQPQQSGRCDDHC